MQEQHKRPGLGVCCSALRAQILGYNPQKTIPDSRKRLQACDVQRPSLGLGSARFSCYLNFLCSTYNSSALYLLINNCVGRHRCSGLFSFGPSILLDWRHGNASLLCWMLFTALSFCQLSRSCSGREVQGYFQLKTQTYT